MKDMRRYEFRVMEENSYEKRLLERTNKVLVSNFNKVADWIKSECPNLNGEFKCKHNVFHWTKLVVENGVAYLEEGGHGYDFDVAMSKTETAVFSRGSMQSIPHAFYGYQFFRNDRLEEFLSQWSEIKKQIQKKNSIQTLVFSNDFTA